MPYCRKCGTKLDEGARFCRNCGTPVLEATPVVPVAPVRRRKPRSFALPVAILIGILLVAFFLAVLTFAPFIPVDSTQSRAASHIGVNTVNLNLEANVADINVVIKDLPDQLLAMDVIAKGSVGLLGSSDRPVQVTFSNDTAGQTMTVTSKVTRQDAWPLSVNLKVTCNVYVDPSAALNLNVHTSVGKATLADTNGPVTIQGLTLQSSTGSVEASLTNQVTLTGDVSVTTSTGSADFTWRNVNCTSNSTVNIASSTGSVRADIMQTSSMTGNIALSTKTTTGSVDFTMNVDGNVGAQITSQRTLGSITVDAQNFNGNQSPITSSNYPAANNFQVNLGTTTGSIHITARYHASVSSAQQGEDGSDVAYAAPQQL